MRTTNLISFLIILIFAVPAKTIAQDYSPMVIEGATWSQSFTTFDPYSYRQFAHRIEGDTLVNDTIWKKVFQVSTNFNKSLVGIIREDIDEKKVYARSYRDPFKPYEFNFDCSSNVYIDFNKNIGDTLNDPCANISQIDVFNIETEYLWGKERKIFNNGFGKEGELIEGVGYANGLFIKSGLIFINAFLHIDNYCVGTLQECFLVNTNDLHTKEIPIYPNPSNDIFNIDGNISIDYYTIYDASGKLILKASAYEIDLSLFPNQMYALLLLDKEGNWYSSRLVKL